MPETVVNNRLIVKNTIFLYVRMLVVMLISLYTVRAFLSILGETDYGLYNVIGGVVGMFSFINSTLATSSQRYFSQALVPNDKKAINRVFCLNLTIYILLIGIIVFLLETVGLWFVNYKMTIPEERMRAANIVYQISIITFIFQMITVSYNALIIAHEKMKTFAFIGILEAVLKLGFVFVMMKVHYDKLITYAVFFLLLYLLIAAIYILYCRKHFEESRFHFFWNKNEATDMLGFSGWHLLGTFSVVVRGYGVNLLINMFFNPAVNAARAVAFQIESAINQLSGNFFTAVKPQMYKSYSNGEMSALHTLVLRSSLICFFLVSILSIPFYFNVEFILGLWLKEVPKYTIVFTQLVIIGALVDSVGGSAICPALATGKIKKFYLVTGSLFIMTLPIAYLFLKMGYEPTSTMVVAIGISFSTLIARALILVELIAFPVRKYFVLMAKLVIATSVIGFITYNVTKLGNNQLIMLILSTIVSTFLHVVIYYVFVCDPQDRIAITGIVKTKLHINNDI